MRLCACLLPLAVLLGTPLAAMADPVDYKSNILDPPPPRGVRATGVTSAFSFSYQACTVAELPAGTTTDESQEIILPSGEVADGCFPAFNATGMNITSFEITVPDEDGVVGQVASCDLDDPDEIFGTGVCTSPGGIHEDLRGSNSVLAPEFTQTYTGGVIAPGDYFVIVESGVAPEDFPENMASFTTSAAVTPEPASFVLLATGLLGACVLRRSLGHA